MLTGFDLCRAALAVVDISAPEQSVLMVLAIMANDDAQCWPPINGDTGLTSKTKLSERAVQRAIQRLKELGHISRRQLRNGCIYTVHPAATPATVAGVSETGDTQAARPATVAPKQPETTSSSSVASPPSRARAAPKLSWPRDMPPPAGVEPEQWAGFIDHRKRLRKALTPRGYDLLTAKLATLAEDGWPPGAMIDRAIERGWLTVFPPNEKPNDARPRSFERPSAWRSANLPDGVEPVSLDP